MITDNVNEKHEDAVVAESNDTQEQRNTDSTQMEEVCPLLYLLRFSVYLG